MDRFEETYKERISALWRAMYATKSIREDNVPCKIEEGLYLGSLGAASNKSALKSFNVTHILTVANQLHPAYPRDFVYKCINIADREDVNISRYFDECFGFIEEAKKTGGGVLVHCFAGRSRSVTIVLAYLIKKHGMSLSEAFEHVRKQRPVASPNSGFMSQLQDLEKTVQGEVAPIFGSAALWCGDVYSVSRTLLDQKGRRLQMKLLTEAVHFCPIKSVISLSI